MAAQRRSQRDKRPPVRLAEEQWRPEDQRRRANMGRRREQQVGEQLLIDDANEIGKDEGVDLIVEEGVDDGGGPAVVDEDRVEEVQQNGEEEEEEEENDG